MRGQAKDSYEFGDFRIDSVERVLLRADEPVPLTPKVFDLLLLLVENNGHVIEKEKLMNEIWPGTFVEEGNLTQNISVLRKVLSAGADGHEFIQTIPRRGYRFVGHVHEGLDEHELIIEERSVARVIVEEHQTDTPPPSTAIVRPASRDVLRTPAKWKPGRTTLFVSVALAAVAIVTAYLLFSNQSKRGATVAALSEPRSIAVLPFRPLNVNSGDEFLGLGMTDALISRLSNIRHANVRPTSAVQKYSGRAQQAATVGKELRVDSVLEGTVQKEGDRIRVSVQLIDVKEAKTVWAHAFDEKFTDIFAVEDAISERIAQAMTLKLTEDEKARVAKHYTDDPAAHESYLQGRFYLNKFTEDGTKLAREYFEQAIAKDSHYAEAYSGLAESYAFGEIGLPPEEAFPKARDAATSALDLDETVGEAHAALAQVAFLWDWDWSAAEKQFKRAIELTPGDPEIHHMYAHYLYAHQFDLAIEQYKLVLAVDPNFAEAHRQLADAYWQKGQFDEALAEMNKRLELVGRGHEVPALKKAFAAGGWKTFWQKRLEFARERSKRTYIAASDFAYFYVFLKDKPRALDMLERALREHDHSLVYLKVECTWDTLRSEPRFQELLRRMRLS